ncbi:putative Bgh-specific protein [Blumeria hordei DH14]|uniref:Putative Bgh-specific protein n=1 Tax=Blumeria graminis f. sp. hordei (strain DH14) TaxID=546991 RepID=N1JEZ7_BLUG1|nr:putative Bgh-specific protein [Blumeria hordei DH14]
MVSCAYALLSSDYRLPNNPSSSYFPSRLRPNERTTIGVPKSLVFLAHGSGNSFYGAYEFPHDGQFPRPNASLDIVKTQESSDDTRTKLVAYCSRTLSSIQIIESFKSDIIPMSESYYAKSVPITTSERNCQDLIEKEWYELLENTSMTPKQLAQNPACSSRDIISLAHRGLLMVTGVYSELAPKYTNQNTKATMKNHLEPENEVEVPKVNIEGFVDLHQMVSSDYTFGSWKDSRTHSLLVWYFGHLHLFERKIGSATWWPKTKIDTEHGNGAILLNFMRYRMKLFKKLDDKIAEYGLLNRVIDFITCQSCISLEAQGKSDHILPELKHLDILRD